MSDVNDTTPAATGDAETEENPYKRVFDDVYEAAKAATRAQRIATESADEVKADQLKSAKDQKDDALSALDTARAAVDQAFADEKRLVERTYDELVKAANTAHDKTIEKAVNDAIQGTPLAVED